VSSDREGVKRKQAEKKQKRLGWVKPSEYTNSTAKDVTTKKSTSDDNEKGGRRRRGKKGEKHGDPRPMIMRIFSQKSWEGSLIENRKRADVGKEEKGDPTIRPIINLHAVIAGGGGGRRLTGGGQEEK